MKVQQTGPVSIDLIRPARTRHLRQRLTSNTVQLVHTSAVSVPRGAYRTRTDSCPFSAVPYRLIAFDRYALRPCVNGNDPTLRLWAYNECMNDSSEEYGSKRGPEYRRPEVRLEPRVMVTWRLPAALVDHLHAYVISRNETVHGAVEYLLSHALNELLEEEEKSRIRSEIINTVDKNARWLNG